MTYPFTPELLDALPEPLTERFRELELTLLNEICSRLALTGELNEVSVQAIKALRSMGISEEEIEKEIRRALNIAKADFDKLIADVVEWNQRYCNEVLTAAKVFAPERLIDAADIEAIARQTKDAFENFTQSMGFVTDSGRTMLPPAKAYQWALDKAALEVQSGAISYNQAIRRAVKQLADSGLIIDADGNKNMVQYESGHRDHLDVAVRRAVMTGIGQLNDKFTEQSAEYLDTQYFEISAHRGARDKGEGWQNHKNWQGKVYSVRAGDKYPSIYEVCGLGMVDGLEGANCRHRRFPFVDGIMKRTYTDEELENIDRPPFEYEGRKYTAYEATQMQRKMERTMRKLKREIAAYKAAGLAEDEQAASIRLNRLREEYKKFSKTAGLPEQLERINVERPVVSGNRRNITLAASRKEAANVNLVCKLDREKYKAVSQKITTDEVVITNERIAHIKERHPNDYERYSKYIADIVENPQYILEANKPNTAFVLKQYNETGEQFELILRLAVEGDKPGYKNSVITFLKLENKRFLRYLRTKKVLYKHE